MKRPLKWILFLLIAVFLLAALLGGGYLVLAEIEYAKFKLLDSGTRIENITILKDRIVNMFVVKNNDSYIVFDAGENSQNVRKQLDQIGIDSRNVAAVFLTHTDFDHRTSIDLFGNAPVYISAEEENMINGQTARALIMHNSLSRPPKTIKNNETVSVIGITVQAILTPGHTAGSTCYLVDDKYLFTGDALSIVDEKIEPFNEIYNMNTAQAKQSIRNITTLGNVSFVFTAHYGVGNNPKELFADWNNRNR